MFDINYIQKFYVEGGFWMHPIAILGVVGFGTSLYRVFFLMLVYNCNGKSLINQVTKLVISGQIDRAIKFCNSRRLSILGQVLRSGLTRHGHGEEAIQAALEESSLKELPKTTRYLNFIGMIANLSTLLGLLGTIFGLIDAFAAVADPNIPQEQKGQLLSSSISIAMNTTAFGLIFSIPLLFVHSILTGISDKINDEVDMHSLALLNTLTKGTSTPGTGARSSFMGEGPRTGVRSFPGASRPIPGGPIKRTG